MTRRLERWQLAATNGHVTRWRVVVVFGRESARHKAEAWYNALGTGWTVESVDLVTTEEAA